MLKTHIDIILKKYRNKYFHNLIILCVFFSYRIKLMFFIQKNNIEEEIAKLNTLHEKMNLYAIL